jgi:hypothetical protein
MSLWFVYTFDDEEASGSNPGKGRIIPKMQKIVPTNALSGIGNMKLG